VHSSRTFYSILTTCMTFWFSSVLKGLTITLIIPAEQCNISEVTSPWSWSVPLTYSHTHITATAHSHSNRHTVAVKEGDLLCQSPNRPQHMRRHTHTTYLQDHNHTVIHVQLNAHTNTVSLATASKEGVWPQPQVRWLFPTGHTNVHSNWLCHWRSVCKLHNIKGT